VLFIEMYIFKGILLCDSMY